MTYNEYRTYILTCEYLGKEPVGIYGTIHSRLTHMWEGVVFRPVSNQVTFKRDSMEWLYQCLTDKNIITSSGMGVYFSGTPIKKEEIEDIIMGHITDYLLYDPGQVSYSLHMRNSDTDHFMRYSEYDTYMKVCEYLGKEPTGQYKKIHDFLMELWDGVEIVVNSLNNRVVFQKKDGWFFEHDNQNGHLWSHNERVWSFFQKDMGIDFPGTQDFISDMMVQYLNCQVGIPTGPPVRRDIWVAKHIRCRVMTT